MPIRLSGLASGMDTEAMVSALVSSYTMQKDNLVKAQTRLSWKQDSWKALNSTIYNFYSGKLAAAKQSKTYNLKTASISNSTYAKVTAASGAVNGTQTLEVKELAAAGYLTGAEISGKDSEGNRKKLSGDSKLSSVAGLEGMTSGSITVSVEGKSTDISVSGDMTVNQFIVRLKDAGLGANFDENNQRFFIYSKTSGKQHDFSMVSNDAGGLKALQGLGLFTLNDTDIKEYREWAGYASDPDALNAVKDAAYKKIEIKYEDRAKTYASKYNAAKKIIDTMEADDTWNGRDNVEARKNVYKSEIATQFAGYELKDDDGNIVTDDAGNPYYDTEKIEADGKTELYNTLQRNVTNLENQLKTYDDNKRVMADTAAFVTFNDEGVAVAATAEDADTTAYDNIVAEVDAENATLRANSDAAIDSKVAYAQQMVADIDAGNLTASDGAQRVVGEDAKIILNNAVFVNNTNNFSINGLTIQATERTGSERVTITTDTDIDGIYNSIKDFLGEYNAMIKAMDTAYNAPSAKGYEPLTSEEKEAMTDDEIEKWEKKIKDSILRKDGILGNASSALKTNMTTAIEINGKKYSLASFGIKTLGYFDSGDNEKGVFHIDGDPDDSQTKGADDKLRAAIANDPETVISFFTQLATNVYTDLGKRMSTSSLSSIYTIYNDKEMSIEYSRYNTKISDKEDEIARWEDYYYRKFSRMESALAALNSQSSSLTSFLGG